MLKRLSILFKQYGTNYFLLLIAAFTISISLYLVGIESELQALFLVTNSITGFTLFMIILIFLSSWKESPYYSVVVLASISSLILLSFYFLYQTNNYNLAHLFSLLSQLILLVSILMVSIFRPKNATGIVFYISLVVSFTYGISFLLIRNKELLTVLDQNNKPSIIDHGFHLLLLLISVLMIVMLLKDDRMFRQPYMGCLMFSFLMKLIEQSLILIAPSHESKFLIFAHVFRMFYSFSVLVVAYIVGISMPAKRAAQNRLEIEANLNEMIKLHLNNLEGNRKTMKRKTLVNQSVHDLINQLSVIVGSLALLESSLKKESTLDPIYQKYLSLIAKNNIQTLKVLNQLSETDDLIESSALLCLNNHDIQEILNSILFQLSPYAERKRQSIEFESGSIKKMIRCDREVVEQIIYSILVGAISLTNRHQTIQISLEEIDAMILLKVKLPGNQDIISVYQTIVEKTYPFVILQQGSLSIQKVPPGFEEVLLLLPQELTV